jgi:hypothetical protein
MHRVSAVKPPGPVQSYEATPSGPQSSVSSPSQISLSPEIEQEMLETVRVRVLEHSQPLASVTVSV